MTIKLDGLNAALLFALVGAVLWLLRQHTPPAVVIPQWAFDDVSEEEDLPTWDDLT